ncbi:MAG: spermidine/putrescine ABC transporter substrate-binding protein, partial [Thermoleophilaceae bacterium]
MALAAALAVVACGGGDGGIEGGSEATEVPTAEAQGDPTGSLTVSNWPFYVDKNTVPEFEKQTGLSVKYIEDVNDNTEFFGKVQLQLEQGQSGGRDIFVVTDWMAKKMYDLGYLQNFDQEAVQPAVDNLIPSLQSPSFDPERAY